ncbi:hypothetical protein [Kordia sp.]|uniref:hypothetical protein n=1 Tax=Kordia sp. TaxID=1965332 RepID=UPI003D297503
MIETNMKIDFPMTREHYVSSWKIFRAISDENVITAKHIIGLNSWNKNISRILDLGCGDGLITRELVLRSEQSFETIKLVDPDTLMINEAVDSIKNTNKVKNIERINSPFEEAFNIVSIDVDIILAIHLVYLIEKESFYNLINNLPNNVTLIIVLDSEDSIFTKLWKRTARKYHDRSLFVRDYIDNLDKKDFVINKTFINSNFVNPYERTDIEKESLLSLLSYSNYNKFNEDDKKFVSTLVKENLINNYLNCKSVCYEVTKVD